jgi:DNA polymerase-3 subunit beta
MALITTARRLCFSPNVPSSSTNSGSGQQASDSNDGSITAIFDRDVVAHGLASVAAALSESTEVDWVELAFLGDGKVQMSTGSPTLSIRYDFYGEYQGTGSIKVNGRELAEYVKQLPSVALHMHVDLPSNLTLKCGRSTARMQLVQDSSHASFFMPETGTEVLAKGDAIERWVNTFKDFVAVDDTRFYANGALLWADGSPQVALHAVASDSLRLAKCRLSDGLQVLKTDSGTVLVPKRALDEVKRVCSQIGDGDVRLRWSHESQCFSLEAENYLMVTKCIAGKYPPYASAIPKETRRSVTLDVRSLLESARRVLLFADKNRVVRLNFDGPVLDVQSATPGQKEGEDVIELSEPVKEPFEVNYVGNLLIGVLSVLNGGSLTFEWDDVHRPVKITGDQDKGLEVFYLIVPTRF